MGLTNKLKYSMFLYQKNSRSFNSKPGISDYSGVSCFTGSNARRYVILG